eukprot:7379639-Prymnesium_polylepis.1
MQSPATAGRRVGSRLLPPVLFVSAWIDKRVRPTDGSHEHRVVREHDVAHKRSLAGVEVQPPTLHKVAAGERVLPVCVHP